MKLPLLYKHARNIFKYRLVASLNSILYCIRLCAWRLLRLQSPFMDNGFGMSGSVKLV